MQIRIQATQRVDKPCLIIDQVSTQPFDAWNLSASNEEDLMEIKLGTLEHHQWRWPARHFASMVLTILVGYNLKIVCY